MNGSSKWIMWIIGILVMITMAVSGYSISKTDALAVHLDNSYLKRAEFKDCMDRIDKKFESIDRKLDRLIGREH